jgi:hypothetical protein
MGDTKAVDVIDSWIKPNPKNKQYDKSAFEATFYEAGFLSESGKKLIKDKLVNAFNEASKTDFDKAVLVRAATGLAQMGSNAGLPSIVAAIKGIDKIQTEDALNGIGGYQNYFQPKSGTGGINCKKDGLTKTDVDELVKVIFERMKFFSGDFKTKGAMAILDMRARLK